MSQQIRRVAVLGAGVMGTGIAAHLANAGIESLLYDIVPDGAKDPRAVAKKGIAAALKSKPPAFFRKTDAALITPCSYDDDADKLATCDWIVEVVVERLDIKQKVFAWVDAHRRADAIVSSNTSGIPLADMTAEMSEAMRRNFLVTHFFNPVRYMRLLELVTGPDTDPAVLATMADFAAHQLGKGVVYGKDTPNFVANRIGTFGMASAFRAMADLDLTIEQVDAIFGPAMGRPKSAVFRTGDLVGIDTLLHVFGNVYDGAPDDEERDAFASPDWVQALVTRGDLGRKTGAGFYKKVKQGGKSVILALDTKTMDYRPAEKVRLPSLGAARKKEGPGERLAVVCYADDVAGQAGWRVTADTLLYSARRIPEIADDIVNIDRGMRWGFGWDLGPFEAWDAIGVRKSVEKMTAEGREIPGWITAMLDAGRESFYSRDDSGTLTYWSVDGGAKPVTRGAGQLMIVDRKSAGGVVSKGSSASLVDIGDGALLLEFHGKLNAIDETVIKKYDEALDALDEGRFEALVVGNQGGRAFCAGANIFMIAMYAMQKDWDSIDEGLRRLQGVLDRAKYSTRPVVVAAHGLCLGGGAEVAMQCSATRASGELYMGLVEVGVGLVPGGGGCKEVIARYLGDLPQDADYDPTPLVNKAFERIGLASVTSSAEEARGWGYLRPTDAVTMDADALVGDAKRLALGLAASGYVPPRRRTMKLPGRGGKAAIDLFLQQMHAGGYATDHDLVVGGKLADVLTGGDIPSGTAVTEERLLELEREAFLSLCGEPKTLARMQHMLQKGKPLRN